MVLFVAPLLHYKGSCQSTMNILNTVWREKRPTSVHFEEHGALRQPCRSNTKLNGSLRILLSCYKQAPLGYIIHVIHAHARESQAQLQRQRHQSRFEFCHASIDRCVCGVWWKCSEESGYTYTGGMFVLVFPFLVYGIKWMFKAIFNILSWI